MYDYEATVLRVIDGDTCDAEIKLGFNISIKVRIRMSGINAPEKRTQKGKEVKKWLQDKIEGKDIILISEGLGKYGRCLGIIKLENININELMLENDLAKPYKGLL